MFSREPVSSAALHREQDIRFVCSDAEARELEAFVDLATPLLEHLQSDKSPAPFVPEGHKRALIGLLAGWNEAATSTLVARDKQKQKRDKQKQKR